MNESAELDYQALCLDTNIFVEARYAFDRGLLAQLDQFAQSSVQVVISEIIAKEMQQQIAELVGKARAALEKGLKDVQMEMLASESSAHRARKAILTGESNEQIAQHRLDQFYERCDATILPADTVSSREVLDRYFNLEPPFAVAGDKKREFPDAYALLSLEKWADDKNFKVIVVSRDRDWRKFCEGSERLVHRAELGAALALFQPYSAARRLMSELNEVLIAGNDEHGIVENIDESIRGSVEAIEIEVQAESRFNWEPDEVSADYKNHEFRHSAPEQVDMDLVRVADDQVVVRLRARITCDAYAGFALSMIDPIDNDEVNVGSQSARIEQTFYSDLLVSFGGDFAQGLAGVAIKSVEVINETLTVEFGEIEGDWGGDDEDRDQNDLATDDE